MTSTRLCCQDGNLKLHHIFAPIALFFGFLSRLLTVVVKLQNLMVLTLTISTDPPMSYRSTSSKPAADRRTTYSPSPLMSCLHQRIFCLQCYAYIFVQDLHRGYRMEAYHVSLVLNCEGPSYVVSPVHDAGSQKGAPWRSNLTAKVMVMTFMTLWLALSPKALAHIANA